MDERELAVPDKVAGTAMLCSAAGIVLAMGHLPSSAHAGALGAFVHGAMIVMAGLAAFGFVHWSRRRGLGGPLVLAGLIAYLISLFGHLGAATINGFVVTALAARGHAAVGHDVLLLAWEANQALARLGVFATATAFALWSADLLRRGGAGDRLMGMAGLVGGILPAALLAAGVIRMDVQGAFIVYAAQLAWTAWVGLSLLRPSRPAAPAAD